MVPSHRAPQHTKLFRAVAFLSRLRPAYLFRSRGARPLLVVAHAFVAGTTALGTITAAAFLTKLPLLFPPLAPTAFIMFHTPLAETASPRSAVLAHSLAVVVGLLAYHGTLPLVAAHDPAAMTWQGILSITLAMGTTSVLMIALSCPHPPAAASALLAAMGYFARPEQLLGLFGAVTVLALEAILFNRIVGGLPYPFWRTDPVATRAYDGLSGRRGSEATFWQHFAAKTFQRRVNTQ